MAARCSSAACIDSQSRLRGRLAPAKRGGGQAGWCSSVSVSVEARCTTVGAVLASLAWAFCLPAGRVAKTNMPVPSSPGAALSHCSALVHSPITKSGSSSSSASSPPPPPNAPSLRFFPPAAPAAVPELPPAVMPAGRGRKGAAPGWFGHARTLARTQEGWLTAAAAAVGHTHAGCAAGPAGMWAGGMVRGGTHLAAAGFHRIRIPGGGHPPGRAPPAEPWLTPEAPAGSRHTCRGRQR